MAALLADSESWAQSYTLRKYIRARVAACKAAGVDIGDGTAAGRWIAWATAQADRMDPLAKGPLSGLDGKEVTGEPL